MLGATEAAVDVAQNSLDGDGSSARFEGPFRAQRAPLALEDSDAVLEGDPQQPIKVGRISAARMIISGDASGLDQSAPTRGIRSAVFSIGWSRAGGRT